MKSKWFWIVISGLGWPAIHYAIGVARFGADNLSITYTQALLDFGLFGLLAGWLYFFFRGRAANDRQARMAAFGYLAAMPFAFIGSLGGGLFLPGALGAMVVGGFPLLIGLWLGRLFGGMGSTG